MEKVIDKDNIRNFAYVNDKVVKRPVKGVVISFFGLGNTTMFGWEPLEGEYFGARGLLYVVPYTNPWAWMNAAAVSFTDDIIDVLFDMHALKADTPIVSTGESMGGLSSFVYTAYAKRTPVACVANCPVCDAPFHYTERPDLPRTMYSAVAGQDGTLEDRLKSISPVHLIDRLPDIDYHIIHCDKDEAVNIDLHSKKFAECMRRAGKSITLDVIHGRGHCDMGYDGKKKFAQYILDAVEKAKK